MQCAFALNSHANGAIIQTNFMALSYSKIQSHAASHQNSILNDVGLLVNTFEVARDHFSIVAKFIRSYKHGFAPRTCTRMTHVHYFLGLSSYRVFFYSKWHMLA